MIGARRLAADDFCAALAFLPGASLAAAASGSSADNAAKFAKRHGFARSYGSYQELADDKEVCDSWGSSRAGFPSFLLQPLPALPKPARAAHCLAAV